MKAAALALALLTAPSLASAGSWKLEFDNRDLPSLSYRDQGKITFMLGCGRALGLHARYPGEAGRAGKATITIGSRRKSMKLVGEFEEISADDDATNFVQWDLGYSRQDPELFGRRWKRAEARLLDLMERASPLTISSRTASYRLPKIDAAGWRAAIEKCGR
ncbi:hypothetical protein TSA1_36895 [Bradyrhizobium nitroreducens]|uniref:Uncharacterized protein n=1 Tax=Bradyrhizobium nitroreducens TaxID=709803 RepID=A0A2M6UMA3_9BRAD|nr:hypothetical protein [Bradyrhizobium nitroreducens]PIT05689.1 hypothetical protein TSA1_36895 [Bradyrhizobium nitroreducens]